VRAAAPADARFPLGDRHDATPAARRRGAADGRLPVAPRYGRYPHTDAGVAVRRLSHAPRSLAMENLSAPFQGVVGGHGPGCARGARNTARFALGAVVGYRPAPLYRLEHGLPLNLGLKAFLKAA
jgi:hypothetical protein